MGHYNFGHPVLTKERLSSGIDFLGKYRQANQSWSVPIRLQLTVSTCNFIKTSFVEGAHEQLEADDGVDDDDKEDEEGDVDEGDDGHEDGVHDNLKTGNTGDQSERSQHSESSQSLDIKTLNL